MRTPPPVLPSGDEDSPAYQRTWFYRGSSSNTPSRAATHARGALPGLKARLAKARDS
ncbi:MAG: hypothetical protein ABI664_10070 [bacterium]